MILSAIVVANAMLDPSKRDVEEEGEVGSRSKEKAGGQGSLAELVEAWDLRLPVYAVPVVERFAGIGEIGRRVLAGYSLFCLGRWSSNPICTW